MRVLGINAVFHDPAAAQVPDGEIAAAAEVAWFSRRQHGKRPVPFAGWELPHSLGLLCESVTEHLGFRRCSDQCKVATPVSLGQPRILDELRSALRATGDGGFVAGAVDWPALTKPRRFTLAGTGSSRS